MIFSRHRLHTSKARRVDEAGFASIVIAIVLVLIMSLLTVGFAELMRQEQRSALDRHLSSQAYYAAESGINDAAKALSAGYDAAKTKCDTSDVQLARPGATSLTNSNVGAGSDGVSYTCLLLNPAPPTLEYSSIDTDQSKVVKISGVLPTDPTATPVPISELDISWQNAATGNGTNGGTSFPPASAWGGKTGILRVGLTPLTGVLTRQTLNDTTFAGFMYPNTNSTVPPTTSYGAAIGQNKGVIVSSACSAATSTNKPLYCGVRITGLSATTYGLDLRSIYNKTRVTVIARNATTQLNIKGAQTMVDSTGKAQDVLRRIQVRIPTGNDYVHSDFSLESGQSICKQLQLTPASSSSVVCP